MFSHSVIIKDFNSGVSSWSNYLVIPTIVGGLTSFLMKKKKIHFCTSLQIHNNDFSWCYSLFARHMDKKVIYVSLSQAGKVWFAFFHKPDRFSQGFCLLVFVCFLGLYKSIVFRPSDKFCEIEIKSFLYLFPLLVVLNIFKVSWFICPYLLIFHFFCYAYFCKCTAQMNGNSCPWESCYIHRLLFSLVIDSREKTPTLIHIILFAVRMSNREAIPMWNFH